MAQTPNQILALDVGAKRIGVAVASLMAHLPRPLTTLDNDIKFFSELQSIIESENVGAIVVGLPRDMQGNSTQQTKDTELFVEDLKNNIDLPFIFQDEALTSQKAEDEFEARGVPYSKADVDALAATFILEDFLLEHPHIQDFAELA
jgi:putative Holliday junction resolvase